MNIDRTMVSSGELRFARTTVLENEVVAREVAATVREQHIQLWSGDPLRTHRHFLAAFAEFTDLWGREFDHVADAALELGTSMDVTAQVLLRRDQQNGNDAGTIVQPPR